MLGGLGARAQGGPLNVGVLIPGSPFELSHAIVMAMTRREIDLIARLAKESGRLEQRVHMRRGDDGVAARSAFGTVSLPIGIAVEVEAIFEVR